MSTSGRGHSEHLRAAGVSCHIGSQILDIAPILEAAGKGSRPDRATAGRRARRSTTSIWAAGWVSRIRRRTARREFGELSRTLRARIGRDGLTVMVEPGRSIVGPAGVLLTRVLYRKQTPAKEFVVVDAAMNDLIRPSLYRSHHDILPLRTCASDPIVADVVGPICETGDFLARDRELADVQPGEYFAIASAGAYGFAQASNYNSRPARPKCLWKAVGGASSARVKHTKIW